MKARRVGAWIAITVLLMAASSAATWWVGMQKTRAVSRQIPASMLHSAQFRRFVAAYRLIRSQSIWHSTTNQLLIGATRGMVGTLHDQFSNYLSNGQTRSLKSELSPSYVGIGIEASFTKPPVIERVFAGSPAKRVGLKAGEAIVDVNGHSTASITPQTALKRIRGPVGTQVTLTVKAGGHKQSMTLTRRAISLPTVYSRMMAHHVAYLNIEEFGQNTGREADSQFHHLMQQQPRGIVLDLRDDPGGEVKQALRVANLFVPPGPVVTLKYKNAKKDVTYKSQGPGTRLPVVVLVNHNTASAAEILSAAIQERQGGKLVGIRTYGKGIVQEVVPLAGGASLKLTVARYYTPDGKYIEHVGLKPNVVAQEPAGVQPSDSPAHDPQLRTAIQVLDNMIKQSRPNH